MQKDIQESNRMIAEFMGVTLYPGDPNDSRWKGERRDYYEGQLMYHMEWSWLMPVWLKILQWGIAEHGVQWQQEITDSVVLISNNKNGDLRCISTAIRGTLSIHNVYSVVIQFITWLNQQK